ncbi:MAG: hypothetical protein E6J70_11660 [Deltaproteobacteria bacterium]|nr:MAG: hypothetical protein E6J70_11660 [Deltaproteobacteria bacterium]
MPSSRCRATSPTAGPAVSSCSSRAAPGLNSHPKLAEEDRLQLQEYITRAYGSLTTFNLLFADAEDRFVGTKGSGED